MFLTGLKQNKGPKFRFLLGVFGLLLMGTLTSCGVLSSDDEMEGARLFEGNLSLASPSMNGVSDSVSAAYRQDAKVIALRYMQQNDSTKVLIPEGTIEFFWKGLIHVYNYDHPARDTVVNIYPVHNYGIDAPYRELLVRVDTTHDWTDAWRNGEIETGNPQVDRITEEYELSLDSQRLTNGTILVVLRSEDPINPEALARTFKEDVSDIMEASPNGRVGGGHYIKARVFAERLTYTYSYGWGDCPAGCIYRRNWEFVIYPNGGIAFKESYGNKLPESDS